MVYYQIQDQARISLWNEIYVKGCKENNLTPSPAAVTAIRKGVVNNYILEDLEMYSAMTSTQVKNDWKLMRVS